MYHKPFVPHDFKVPQSLEWDAFTLNPLTMGNAEKDYEAIQSSADYLKGALGDEWPFEGMTREDGKVECAWHEEEFKTRASFTYAVCSPDGARELGCVYILPSLRAGYDAQVLLWVRKDEHEKGLDEKLFATVKTWIKDAWPFTQVAYPGREIAWEDWRRLPYKY